MTREEALNKIGELVVYARAQGWDDDYTEAFEALSAEPCEDCISRQALLDMRKTIEYKDMWHMTQEEEVVSVRNIKALAPVTPKQKMGYWIIKSDSNPKCSECGKEPYYSNTIYDYKFCPYCGQPKMFEPQAEKGGE